MILASKDFHNDVMASVVLLAYNHEKFIEECLNSIVSQRTTFAYEIILGEDCSSDGTKKICLAYQLKYPDKIKLILHETNQGLIGNYKSVLQLCRGKYIAVCACDDYWCDENKLQKHIDYMEKHSNVVVTYHDVKTIDEDGTILSEGFLTHDCKKDYTAEELIRCVWIIPLSMCFRNKVINELISSINNNVFLEDVFTISIFGNYGSGAFIESKAAYRFSTNSVWSMQRDCKKKLMQSGTYAELSKYYKKKGNESLFIHFISMFRSGLADSLNLTFNKAELKLFITLLWRYKRYLPIKDFLYYHKFFLTKYPLTLFLNKT